MPKSSKYSGSDYKPNTEYQPRKVRIGKKQITTPADHINIVTRKSNHDDPVKNKTTNSITIQTINFKEYISRFLKEVEDDIEACKNEEEKEALLIGISRSVDQEIEDSVCFTKWEGHNPKLNTTKRSALKAKGYYREVN